MQTIYTPYNFTVSDISSGPPSSPSTGDIWIASNVDAVGTRWQFQYNAGSASAYKWEFIGGNVTRAIRGSTDSITSNSAVVPDTNLGTITVARPGDYGVRANLWIISMPAAVQGYFLKNGSNSGNWGAVSSQGVIAMDASAITFAANDTFGAGYFCASASSFSAGPRTIGLIPVRVS